MTRTEIAALISYAAGLDPRTARDNAEDLADQFDQWADLLSDVPPTAPHPTGRHWNAARAVRHHIATSPYPIKPSDVSRPWHAFKADILARHHDPLPAADPDDPAAWRAELANTRHAVATGHATAAPLRELLSGDPATRDRHAADRLRALGEYMPRTVAQQLAAYRPRRARREALATTGQPDPLDVPCTWCQAPPGEQCRARQVRADGAHASRRRTTAHPTRVDAAAARTPEHTR